MRYSVKNFIVIISILVFLVILALFFLIDINGGLISAASDGNIDKIKWLLKAGANVDAKNNDGYTALMVAKSKGYEEIVKILSIISF